MTVPTLSQTEFNQELVRRNPPLDVDIAGHIHTAGLVSTICFIAYEVFDTPVFISAVIGLSMLTVGLIARKIINRYSRSIHFDQIAMTIERKAAWLLPTVVTISFAVGFVIPTVSHITWAACGLYAGISWEARRIVHLTR